MAEYLQGRCHHVLCWQWSGLLPIPSHPHMESSPVSSTKTFHLGPPEVTSYLLSLLTTGLMLVRVSTTVPSALVLPHSPFIITSQILSFHLSLKWVQRMHAKNNYWVYLWQAWKRNTFTVCHCINITPCFSVLWTLKKKEFHKATHYFYVKKNIMRLAIIMQWNTVVSTCIWRHTKNNHNRTTQLLL